MLRNKLVVAGVGVLFVVVVLYNLNFFLKKKAPAGSTEKAVSVVYTDNQSRAGGALLTSHLPLPRDKEKWKRDPFEYSGKYTGQHIEKNGDLVKPDDKGKKKAPGIKLMGIKVRDGKLSALVNGWVVEPGDRIDDVLITRVTRYSIFVKDAAGIREISIYNDIHDKEK